MAHAVISSSFECIERAKGTGIFSRLYSTGNYRKFLQSTLLSLGRPILVDYTENVDKTAFSDSNVRGFMIVLYIVSPAHVLSTLVIY